MQQPSKDVFPPYCVCNQIPRDTINQKMLNRVCKPTLVNRTLNPRPGKVSPCVTTRAIQTETVSNQHKEQVNTQWSALTHVESQLLGHCRSSVHNYIPTQNKQQCTSDGWWKEYEQPPPMRYIRNHTTRRQKCYQGTGTSQTRSPYMANAPVCRPLWADEQPPAEWHSQMPCHYLEPQTWNNHPYMLDMAVGVKRNITSLPCLPPLQDSYQNSTRRKLTIR